MPEPRRFPLDLIRSVCTKSIDEEIHPFDDPEALHLQNTGIERNGGISSIYEVEAAHPEAGQYFVTKRNKLLSMHLSGSARNVKIDGRTIGQVSAYGVEARRQITGVDDAVVSSEIGYLVTAKLTGQVVTLSNVLISTGVVAASRTITFTALAGLSGYTSLSIVRKNTQEYLDANWEFIVKIGERCLLLKEGTPTYATMRFSNVTDSMITAICTHGTVTVFGNRWGQVFSVDSLGRYRYPDGSGDGSGPWNNGDALAIAGTAPGIQAMVSDGTVLVICAPAPGSTHRLASWDGSAWRRWDGSGSGTGPYQSAGPIGTGWVYAAILYGNYFVFGGASGLLSSYDRTTKLWKYYDGTGTGAGPYNNATVIGANNIRALAMSGSTLVVAGNGGRLGNWNGSAWTTYTGGGAAAQPYNNASVVSTDTICSLLYFGSVLIVGSSAGKIGNYQSGPGWTTYTGGGGATQPYDNATRVGAFGIYSMLSYNSTVLILGYEGSNGRVSRLASWDGSNWKSYDGTGTGTGLYKDATKALDFGTAQFMVLNTHLFFAGYGRTVYVYNTVAAAFESVHGGIDVPQSYFGISSYHVRTAIYRDPTTRVPKFYIVAVSDNSGTLSQISSWDGVAWKHWDGTGSGTGPYDNSTVLGTNRIMGMIQYGAFLVVYGDGGRIGNWNGTAWTTYTGGGAASQPYDNGTVVGADQVTAAGLYNTTILVVGSVTGRIANFNGAAWTTYLGGGAAAQPYNNATVIGAVMVYNILQFGTPLVVCGGSGRLGNYTVAGWTTYAGGGPATQPYNNATALTSTIYGLIQYGIFLVLCGAGYQVASWDGTNWKNYDGTGTGTGPYSNHSGAGSSYYVMGHLGQFLYVFDTQGYINSFDGTAWRYADGTGAGTGGSWLNQISGQSDIFTVCHWNGGLITPPTFVPAQVFAGAAVKNLQAMSAQQFRTAEARSAQLFVWKIENDSYLIGIVGNIESTFYCYSSAGEVSAMLGRFVVMQTYSGKTRALVYGTPTWYDTVLEAVGIVGYVDFSTYSTIVNYPPFGDRIQAAANAVIGVGSLDLTYTKVGVADQIWSAYSPQFAAAETSLLGSVQSGTSTTIGAYGKLTNAFGLPAALEFRLLWVGSSQSTLSVAIVDGVEDTLGVLLSAVGEVDDGYLPDIYGNSILYRAGGKMVVIVLGTTVSSPIQRIANRLYKLNTLHPLNLYDDDLEALAVSSCDYNGRALFSNTATPAVTSKKFAAVIYTELTSSIDVGDKLVQHTTLDSSKYSIVGHRLPGVATILPNYGVDVYVEDLYYRTTLSNGSELTDPAKVNTLYLTSTDLPIPIGWEYRERTAAGESVTVFPTDSRDVYAIGNETPGRQDGFSLFGQRYLFDGLQIWLAVFDGTSFSTREALAQAAGLVYIGSSPTAAFFVSSFDNSLYTFDGGRTLQKGERFNNETAITHGVWSTRDNALLLEATDRFLWIRDTIITRNLKKAAQTTLQLADTIAGVVVWNDSYRWRYPYVYEAGAVAVQLTWQSAYYGTPGNQKTVFSEWIVTLFNEAKTLTAVTFTCRAFDLENITTETRRVTVNPTDWTGVGFTRLRVRPPAAKCLAQSIQLDTTSHVLIAEVVAEITEEAKGLTPSARSA